MKRYFMAFIGVILIGFNVTLLNLSGFGVDTFSCMNMAVSEHLPFSYGVWQIIVNIVIFIGLFIFVIKEKKRDKCHIWIWNFMEHDRMWPSGRLFYSKISYVF